MIGITITVLGIIMGLLTIVSSVKLIIRTIFKTGDRCKKLGSQICQVSKKR